jgi:hypothetical protein
MSLLRFAAYKSLMKFLPWVSPKVAENDAENACETMEASYAWTRDAPWRAGSLKDDLANSGVPFATKIVFLELPLLEYSVAMLHGHLREAEEARIFQSSIVDIFVSQGVQWLRLWYGFQDALQLPRRHRLGEVSEELWPAILPLEGISIHIKADNNEAIGLSAGTTPHPHPKYFGRMEVNYVQEQVQLQRVLLQKIPTEANIADVFTKPCQSPNLGDSVKV